LLFNNAGVSVLKSFMGQTLEDLEWILNVNLWGVIYGVKVFVPIMTDQNIECHIVNTASGFSFTAGAGGYGIAKHGVRVITEMMASELLTAESKIKVSMLVPGWVNTRILEAERNRPKKFINKDDSAPITPEMEKARNEAIEEVKKMVGEAQDPDEVADIMFEGIINEDLHIFTDFEMLNGIKERAELVTSSFKSLEKYWEKRKGS
jgi:NAD(P)-dependent dehydrogenase (short-subunit alcohol dehydrogenase family)